MNSQNKQKVISEYMAELGRRGGQAKLEKYGVEYFKEISKKAVIARKKKREEEERSLKETLDNY